jgi:DNA polymerase V
MNVIILGPLREGGIKLPLYSSMIPAGFPSPAADHIEQDISLDEMCNVRAPHVYLAKIIGDSMQGAGIFCGCLIVVDRSQQPENGHVVVAALNGEHLCKRLYMRGSTIVLKSENKKYPPRYIMEGDELIIWGVVNHYVGHLEKA